MKGNDMNFDNALKAFCDHIDEDTKEYSKKFDNLEYGTSKTDFFQPIEVKFNQKRIKLIKNSGNHRSVYCFIDRETGDILKAASWSTPAKGARGNIFDPSTYEQFDLSGTGWMYRR